MALCRSIITNYFDGDVPRDYSTNTVYHDIGGEIPLMGGGGPDFQNHANELLAAFTGGSDSPDFGFYKGRHVEVRCYDMADPIRTAGGDKITRPERGYAAYTGNTGDTPQLATELALVLSFYGDRNIAGLRGRLFVGPITAGGAHTEGYLRYRPSDPQRVGVLSLGHALWNIGGSNVHHVIYHPKATKSGHAAGTYDIVHHYNVADSWGVIHSRGRRATSRMALTP